MSLSFLPRGVAAKRVAVRDESIASPSSGQPEQMQLDVSSSPSSSTGMYSQSGIPSHATQGTRGHSQPSTSSAPKVGFYQRKPPPPIKPRELWALIETSMSDYALWANPDLQRYAADRNTSGYVSLSRLLNESPLIQATGQTIAEASVFQALKDYGTGFLELQLKLTTAARNRQKAGGDSLYNIRRVDWEGMRTKVDVDTMQGGNLDTDPSFWDRTQDAWNERTVYVENIPRKHWSLPQALLFIHSCTQASSNPVGNEEQPSKMQPEAIPSTESLRIQYFELPAHAKASPDDVPVCKGFAFVTFSHVQESKAFLAAWPWAGRERSTEAGPALGDNEDDAGEEDVGNQLMNLDLTKERDEHEEAVKDGTESELRSISLNDWEELKKEYLAWKAGLYEGMKSLDSGAPKYTPGNQRVSSSVEHSEARNGQRAKDMPPHMTRTGKPPEKARPVLAPIVQVTSENETHNFPQGCLLFVKNLHPQTNKTTLKELFENALETASIPRKEERGIDYVDWSKGMSSCHLRLSDAMTARALVGYFTTNPTVQTGGDDDKGQPLSKASSIPAVVESGLKPLVTEQVERRAEEIYWEKVPQKIKMAALAKSKAVVLADVASFSNAASEGGRRNSEEIDRRVIKRSSEEPRDGERESKRRRKA